MARNSPHSSSASEQPVDSTDSYQKHYSSGYPDVPYNSHHHRGGHHYAPPLPPSDTQYPPPPPLPPHHHRGGYPHPPPNYYPEAPVPESSSRRISSRVIKKPRNFPQATLVTPKSPDESDTLPPVAETHNSKASRNNNNNNKVASKGTHKRTSSKRKESGNSTNNHDDKELLEMEELTVEPMKQDFHYYAMDHYDEVKQICEKQLAKSIANGSIQQKNKENHLFLLTTLINTLLIKNWEAAPASTRAEYLKREEADRKRFMSEEEVASRHCATLTARRRSPKQSGPLGKAGSFGLGLSTIPSLLASSDGDKEEEMGDGPMKRPGSADIDEGESLAKRVKTTEGV